MRKVSWSLISLIFFLVTATNCYASVIGHLDSTDLRVFPWSTQFTFTDSTSTKSIPGSLTLSFTAKSTLLDSIFFISGVKGTTLGSYDDLSKKSLDSTYVAFMRPSIDPTTKTMTLNVDYNSSGVYSFYVAVTSAWGPPMYSGTPLSKDLIVGKFQDINLTKVDPPTGATPLPAAVWLLGSGLMGLVGLRKKFQA